MNVFELLWFVFHIALLLFGGGWLCQILPWYVAIPATIAGIAVLIGLEIALSKLARRGSGRRG